MKKGEAEAKRILEMFGIQFDDSYQDNNVGNSMADLRYKDGRYLEVTHTRHNNGIFIHENKFAKKSFEEQMEVTQKVNKAISRINNVAYKRVNGVLTSDALVQYNADKKLLKKHLNYNASKGDFHSSEFKCDAPIIRYSADNILNEINLDKGKKYPNGDVDLFIFVTKEEFDLFFGELKQVGKNIKSNSTLKKILKSPFPVIYISIWNIKEPNYYEIDSPIVMMIEKESNEAIKIRIFNK